MSKYLVNQPIFQATFRHVSIHCINSIQKGYNPVDTGRKLNVHKTFRRRSGRLLNVLCTFNLRPVSTGKG